MATARFIQTGDAVDYTPGADVSAGDVVVQGDLVGVAKLDIAAGKAGSLALTGVDYQPQSSKYLKSVRATPGMVNVLLSHNPDVFNRAAQLGFDLTLAGHTHGGQIDVEILHEHLNVARFFTPYVYGLYRKAGRSIYVSGGLGTVGAPVRLGAPPEVTVVKLCAG